jgi:anti-sigma regulatory factor (Ser/Thr protein kinase)
MGQGPTVAPRAELHVTSYPGRVDQVCRLRRELAGLLDGYPEADDVVLCASELAANAVQHSRSGAPGGSFTLSVEVSRGEHVRIAVEDAGGPWLPGTRLDHGRGLGIVAALAADWGVVAGPLGRQIWAQFGWPSR